MLSLKVKLIARILMLNILNLEKKRKKQKIEMLDNMNIVSRFEKMIDVTC